jgi:hypothetical protein
MTKQRHLRSGDRLEDDATIVIRGGRLDPDDLRADALRYHAVYGSYGISVFAARDAAIEALFACDHRSGPTRIMRTDLHVGGKHE